MAKSSQLLTLMSEDLPSITYQKRYSYRTSQREVLALYRLINKEIFENKLHTPNIRIFNRMSDYWGLCQAKHFVPVHDDKSNCIIELSNKWFCKQWLIATLAHEMVHQYQWDINNKKRKKLGLKPLMSHGPSFFMFRDKLSKYGIPLKSAYSTSRWLKYQNLFKC